MCDCRCDVFSCDWIEQPNRVADPHCQATSIRAEQRLICPGTKNDVRACGFSRSAFPNSKAQIRVDSPDLKAVGNVSCSSDGRLSLERVQ